MDLSEMIGDAITYPLHNIKSLIIFMIIGIVGGLLSGMSIVGMLAAVTGQNAVAAGGFGIIGLLIGIIAYLLISGYTLDIVKFGIERREDGPGIDFVRQIVNAIKLIVVNIVYYIVPAIIVWLLTTLLGNGILTLIIAFIVAVVFTFMQIMAICRLAKYDSLGEALAFGEALGDLSKAGGILKVLATIIVIFIIAIIIAFIIGIILNYNATIGGILLGIFGVYFIFFSNRAIGLLYSEV